MKKNLVLILCLSLIFILVGCKSDKNANKSVQDTSKNQTLKDDSKDINNPAQATNDKNSIDEKKETDSNNTNSIQSTKVSPNEQVVKDKGNNYTLNFTFPSVTEIAISGFKPLEGKTYLNNGIPGHECS